MKNFRIDGNAVQAREAVYHGRSWHLVDWLYFGLASVSHFQPIGSTLGEDLEVVEIHFNNGTSKTIGLNGEGSDGDNLISAWRKYCDTH